MASRLSDETINQIPILYKELKNKSEVAKRLNISVSSVNKYLTIINGAASSTTIKKEKKKRVQITEDIIKEINEQYKQYKNMSQVAKNLGISSTTVKKYLNEENIKLSKSLNDDRDALWYYIYRLFGQYSEDKPVSDWNLTQMMKFKNQGMSFAGQLLTLKYFFEIRKSSIEKSKGSIGIIPYIFSEAAEYYKKKEREQQEMIEAIKKQLEQDRVEIKYNPSDYIGKKKKKKEIDLNKI